ncbi:hypothetical protein E2C01_038129 [Portunus trituberculatus]|uniref:Uncharacterized protein n=1 Tax=Portunus trituberculatus TaxID=210409 RepID=A0A5B7FGF8_PORTR|nr:hypothetical protein [Portunus trituberculatus]
MLVVLVTPSHFHPCHLPSHPLITNPITCHQPFRSLVTPVTLSATVPSSQPFKGFSVPLRWASQDHAFRCVTGVEGW